MSADSGAAALPPCPHCGDDHAEDKLKCPKTDLILPLAGRILHDKFRFLEPIGRGGMAEVWLARNEFVDREVALKLIRPEVARHEENVTRFRSEAKAAGRIGSRQICEVLDFGHSPIGPYIVMERLRGVNLGDVLRARKTLAPEMAAMIIRDALSALGAAHRAGIIHRDLKPENIFLHRPVGGDPIVKLMDFGVSKFTEGGSELETEHGVLLGTPEYMAPEQCKGARHADARADIWAMGAILYRALAGRDAFHGESLAATLMIVATGDATPLSELTPGLDPALVDVVEKCLTRNPDERFQTAEELAEALAPFEAEDRLALWTELGGVSETLSGLASAPTQVKTPRPSDIITAPREQVGPKAAETAPPLGQDRPARWPALIGLALLVAGGAFALSRLGGDDVEPKIAAARAEQAEPPETKPPPTDPPTPTPPEPAHPEPATPEPAPNQAPPLPEPAGEAEAGDPGRAGVPAAPRELPPGVVLVEKWITPIAVAKTMEQGAARRHCEKLAADRHLGASNWKLGNPSITSKFVKQGKLKKARFWTSAAHKGRATTISLPAGKRDSHKVTKKAARPFCIARWLP